MQKLFLIISGLSGAVSVILGALGAHALNSRLSPDLLASFETGVRYQFWHTLALLAVVLLSYRIESRLLTWTGYMFTAGIILFSGSIYFLSTRPLSGLNINWMGPVTPVGGLCFISGWILLLIAAIRLNG